MIAYLFLKILFLESIELPTILDLFFTSLTTLISKIKDAISVAWSNRKYFDSPLDGMLLNHKVTSSIIETLWQ